MKIGDLTMKQLKKLQAAGYKWISTEDKSGHILHAHKTEQDANLLPETFNWDITCILYSVDDLLRDGKDKQQKKEWKENLLAQALATPHLAGDKLIEFLKEIE